MPRSAVRARASSARAGAVPSYDAPSPPPLWLDRREAQPYRARIESEAARWGLPPAVLAELIGLESGFRNIRNRSGHDGRAVSSAGGLGQQLASNPYLHGGSRFNADVSIAAAAEEFSVRLRRAHGDLAVAANGYGVTAGMPPASRRAKLAALQRALALSDPVGPVEVARNR